MVAIIYNGFLLAAGGGFENELFNLAKNKI